MHDLKTGLGNSKRGLRLLWRRTGFGRFFDDLTTIPPMLHHETVQRNLTHIPARFSAVQEVCVGLDEVSFQKKSQKKSPWNCIFTCFRDQMDVSMPTGLSGITRSMGSSDMASVAPNHHPLRSNQERARFAAPEIDVVFCAARFNDERFRISGYARRKGA